MQHQLIQTMLVLLLVLVRSYKMYKLNNFRGEIVSVTKTDGEYTLTIPLNALDNTDYQAYLKWVAEGNTPLPADE